MSPIRWPATAFGLAAWLVIANMAAAQQAPRDPQIAYVYPAGGRQGTSFNVTVGGQFLDGASQAHVSGGGVRVSVSRYYKHLTQNDFNALKRKLDDARDRLEEKRKAAKAPGDLKPLPPEEIAKEAGVTSEQRAQMEDYRKRSADPKRQLNPQLMEEVTLQVKMAADARPGERELRLITPAGMSNPLYFHVSPFSECLETEPNDKTPAAVIGDTLPVVVNGQIMPGDVDRFSFKATKGTRLVAAASARELIPYLADTVPGWFQAVLALYDAAGNELAFASAHGFRQDPVFSYEIPADGEYTVEIRDALYRGREDFVYRIALGELPFVTHVFPLGGRAGTQVPVELHGWNLPTETLKVDAFYDRGRPLRSVSVRGRHQTSNTLPFAVDMLPEGKDQEPNNQLAEAQVVTLPIIVNGRIDQPGDWDVFRFEGHAGDRIIGEVWARRLGSPVDSLLKLLNAEGQELAASDDYEDRSAALSTHHADSRISFALPANGAYYLRLGDTQRQGGAEHGYRLHIRPPRPDFDLRVVPSSLTVRTGAAIPITVYALRKDDFAEDITLDLVGAPAGFKLDGAWVPAGQDKVRLTLTVPGDPTPEPLVLQMEGRAVVRGRKLAHPAIPAEAMMQAFAYHHLVPTKDWTVMVTGRSGAKPQLQWADDKPVKLIVGSPARVRVVAAKSVGDLRFELSEPPDGLTIESVSPDGPGAVIVLKADAAKVKKGTKGNLIVNAFSERTTTTGEKATTRRTPIGTMPAVAFEVVGF